MIWRDSEVGQNLKALNKAIIELGEKIFRLENLIRSSRKKIEGEVIAPKLTPNDYNRQMESLAPYDISAWRIYQSIRNNNCCPTCNINFNEMHPLANLYPHWIGECEEIT